jgi:hypothetical protein
MPNHCFNRVEIHCKSEEQKNEIKKFLESEETCFDLSHILPEPDYETIEVKPTFGGDAKDNVMPGWWDWRIQNWGTKWNTYDDELCETEDTLEYRFSTAWAPPEMAIAHLREIYKEERDDVYITAFYDEPGMEIAGYY